MHELHNNYTLAPKKIEIKICCQLIVLVLQINVEIKIGGVNKLVPNLIENAPKKIEIKICCQLIVLVLQINVEIKIGGVNKLVPNLVNECKYVVHCKNLQLHLSLGMKMTEAHRILKFKQSDWLKKYIDFNKDKKVQLIVLKKIFFKLMSNSAFGKIMENLRERMSVKLDNNAKDYVKCISKPSFVSQKIFSENFVAIHEIKPVLILNKPTYVGFSILGLSK